MALTSELLCIVLSYFSRWDLDIIALTSKACYELIEFTSTLPLRLLVLTISEDARCTGKMTVWLTDSI